MSLGGEVPGGSNIISLPSTRQLLSCDRKFMPMTLESPNSSATTTGRSSASIGPICKDWIVPRCAATDPFAVLNTTGNGLSLMSTPALCAVRNVIAVVVAPLSIRNRTD